MVFRGCFEMNNASIIVLPLRLNVRPEIHVRNNLTDNKS